MPSNPTNLKNRNLKAHMWHSGNLSNPDTLPDVYDNEGQIVTKDTRLLSNSSAVDVGDSPNSNTGDPLRLAFIKVNNFMEASFWTNTAIDSDITEVKTDINNVLVTLDSKLDSEYARVNSVINNVLVTLDSKLDSEYARVNSVIKSLDLELDSEYAARIANQIAQQISLDSDSIVIQKLAGLSSQYSTGTASQASPLVNGVMWYDTTNSILKIYNSASSAWIDVGSVSNASGSYQFSTDGGSF